MSVTSPRTLAVAPFMTPARDPQWHLQRAMRHLRAARQALLLAWQTRRRHAADRALLHAMDEHELRDLGLGRGDIGYITRAGGHDPSRGGDRA